MSAIADIHATLDAMGVEQQACVFAFLMSYPFTLGALLPAKGRRAAAGVAAIAAVAFTLCTDPWLHAVVLIVLAIGAVGAFIAAVVAVDMLSRAVALRGLPRAEQVNADRWIEPAGPPRRRPASRFRRAAAP